MSPAHELGLLPSPQEVETHPGSCTIGPDSRIELGTRDSRIERELLHWRVDLQHRRAANDPRMDPSALPDRGFRQRIGRSPGPSTPTTIHVTVDPTRVRRHDGYDLRIHPRSVELLGHSPAGCFHGLQTLRQLSRGRSTSLPCCRIHDWPDYETRGLLRDVTRGRVPTLEALKHLVDRLAHLKVNQLQLYIEHAFVFSFDPGICDPDDGLTPDEVVELDGYCRERFIDLVPALATFGHMGRILSMPKYRHLAEVPTTKTWDEMTWPERARGLTLDCMNPEAHRLVERMWSDVLDAFSSPVVNICGDEPWDLGQGRNRERFAGKGRRKAYIEQLRRTHDLCAKRGRKTQFWSDVVRNHPDLLDRLPRESTVLHWGYDDDVDYVGTGTFVMAGLKTFVSPGTSGWKRIINAVNLAERNIATFAAGGCKHGASGLLNTDWGDHGHFNLPACSWHGIALGAALGWSADHPTGEAFDERFAQALWQTDDVAGVRLLREASRIAANCETWRLLWTPFEEVCQERSLPDFESIVRSRQFAGELRSWCESAPAVGGPASDFKELAIAASFCELVADKLAWAIEVSGGFNPLSGSRRTRRTWADDLVTAGKAYAERWRARNKPSGLNDILRALSAAAADMRSSV